MDFFLHYHGVQSMCIRLSFFGENWMDYDAYHHLFLLLYNPHILIAWWLGTGLLPQVHGNIS
jgi:hypothetical protein